MVKGNGRKPKEKRYDSTFATILRELLRVEKEDKGVKLEDVAKALGVTRQSLAQYRDGNNIPDVVLLSRMADYFGVSTDYLLGRTPNKTTDANLKAVCDYTGLSEKAVEMIYGISKSPDLMYSNALNLTLSSPQFALLILGIRQWLNNLDLLKGAIDTFKQKFYEYDEEPPKDIMKCVAEMSLSDPKNCCLHGEAYDIMEEQDNLNYREYNIQNQLKRLLDKLKKDGENNG